MTLSTTSSSIPRRRPRLLAILLGLTLTGALSVGVVDTAHSQASHERTATLSRAVFHDEMRKLWEDHVTWTRLAIVTFADGSGGFDATAARLMQNQEDIGDAIKPFYGKAAGNQLTSLLKDHIQIAVQLLQAAKDGDDEAFQSARSAWYANANDIADFLASANPRYWPRKTMRSAMKDHLDMTLTEASHELTGDYAASVADYDMVHDHILHMADVLSRGIIRAFPDRFH